jgi:peptidoglycan/LPS O-acetylase OafA/YrhL
MSSWNSESPRYFALDVGRLIAAITVFIGHLLFNFAGDFYVISDPIGFLKIFKYGALSVLFFFVLSGFVLEPYLNFAKKYYYNWLTSRLARLYPVYIFSYLIAVLPYLILAPKLPAPGFTIIISSLGLQSLFQSTYLSPPNPPLWSLSIEIIFAIIFPLIPKKRIHLFHSTFTLGLIAVMLNNVAPFLMFLFYFYLGIVIRKILPNITTVMFRLIALIWIPILLYSDIWLLQDSFFRELWGIVFVTMAIISLANFSKEYFPKYLLNLSKRTYSLYAVHWPVLVTMNYTFQTLALNLNLLTYIAVAIILVSITTEISYRIIELPSLNISKKLRDKR